jgi:hypothetical protein
LRTARAGYLESNAHHSPHHRHHPSAHRRHRLQPSRPRRIGPLLKRGWPARYPVAQVPNAPLLAAFAAWLLALVTNGSVHAYARAAFYAALAAWAWGELTEGANIVRRLIGVAGLVYVVVKVGQALGA